jgi:hypothetical protein
MILNRLVCLPFCPHYTRNARFDKRQENARKISKGSNRPTGPAAGCCRKRSFGGGEGEKARQKPVARCLGNRLILVPSRLFSFLAGR